MIFIIFEHKIVCDAAFNEAIFLHIINYGFTNSWESNKITLFMKRVNEMGVYLNRVDQDQFLPEMKLFLF